jgi:hypothetical protein
MDNYETSAKRGYPSVVARNFRVAPPLVARAWDCVQDPPGRNVSEAVVSAIEAAHARDLPPTAVFLESPFLRMHHRAD